jgi:hypothetical protein
MAKSATKRAARNPASTKPATVKKSDAELSADLRSAAEHYDATVRAAKAAVDRVSACHAAAVTAGLEVGMGEVSADIGTATELGLVGIYRPL